MALALLRRPRLPQAATIDVGAETVVITPTLALPQVPLPLPLPLEVTPDEALTQLAAEFPSVTQRVLMIVFYTYQQCLGSASGAMEATRARILDACAA